MSFTSLGLSVIIGHVINTVKCDIWNNCLEKRLEKKDQKEQEDQDQYELDMKIGLFYPSFRDLGANLVNGTKTLKNLSAQELDVCKNSIAHFEKSTDSRRQDVVRHIRAELPDFNI